MDERAELLAKIKTPDERFDERGNRVLIALAEFQNGFPVDQLCVTCGGLIVVKGLGEPFVCAWSIDCPCHECQADFRGL
ncbi:hypothetical protein [Luteolibacter soli]|uniref:Uncharacterized protein n=1 Tax=Luteolibacter soli TaxID=3135280 RepID=A0ABU9AUS4_9BACT